MHWSDFDRGGHFAANYIAIHSSEAQLPQLGRAEQDRGQQRDRRQSERNYDVALQRARIQQERAWLLCVACAIIAEVTTPGGYWGRRARPGAMVMQIQSRVVSVVAAPDGGSVYTLSSPDALPSEDPDETPHVLRRMDATTLAALAELRILGERRLMMLPR